MERFVGEDLEQDRTEGVDVRRLPDVGGFAQLLGRHVARRADQVSAFEVEALRSTDHAGQPPIQDVHVTEIAEHDVRGLEIAMDDAARVRELDREADIGERTQQALARGDWRARELGERDAGEPLHREERAALVVRPEIVDRQDRRVIEAGLDPSLAQKARGVIGARVGRVETLERDLTADS